MESESGSSASAPLAQTHKKRKRDGGSGEEGKRKSKGKKADHGEGRVEDKPKKKRKRKVASSDVEPEEDRIVVPPLHPNPYMEGWRRERAAQEAVQRNYVKREDEERSESTVDVEPDEVDHGEDGKVFTVGQYSLLQNSTIIPFAADSIAALPQTESPKRNISLSTAIATLDGDTPLNGMGIP